MFRGAGYRSPTLTLCRNGLLAKNAKRRHGFCSEITCLSNALRLAKDYDEAERKGESADDDPPSSNAHLTA
jgi:hypothetical protein